MRKDGKSLFGKTDVILLGLILLVALIFRCYRVTAPLADFHSWRQVDTAAVSRNMVRDGIDLLHPRYDDLSSIQTGLDNPEGYRMVEFPIYNALVAVVGNIITQAPIEVLARAVSIFFSLITIAILYYLALKESSRLTAVAASVIYAVFPFFVFFSRVVLPEATAVGFGMLSIFFLYLHTHENRFVKSLVFYFLSLTAFACALLIKPTTIFYGLILLYLFVRKYRAETVVKARFYLFFIVSALPLALWRYFILSYPEGVPASDWLITSVNTPQGLQRIFFRPAFFRWIFFERLNNMILGGLSASFLIIGALRRHRTYLFVSFLFAALTYLFVFQGGNVQHEYYQIIILPAIALLTGAGIEFVFKNDKLFQNIYVASLAVLALLGFSWYTSYYRVKDFYDYPKDLPQIGRIINTLTTPKDRIVTDTVGDTTLLYLADRKGAPAVFKDLETLKKKGYTHFYTNKTDVIAQIKKETSFTVVFENDKFALFRL